jgi:hypothetical protein
LLEPPAHCAPVEREDPGKLSYRFLLRVYDLARHSVVDNRPANSGVRARTRARESKVLTGKG